MRGVWPHRIGGQDLGHVFTRKEMPESTATFSVEAAGQVYNQTNEFVYLGGNVNHNADLSIEVDRCIRNVPPERSPRAQNTDDKSRGTRDNAVRLRHVEPVRVPLRHSVGESTIAPTTRFPTRLSRREVKASRRLFGGGGLCLRDLWRAWRIRDCRSCRC